MDLIAINALLGVIDTTEANAIPRLMEALKLSRQNTADAAERTKALSRRTLNVLADDAATDLADAYTMKADGLVLSGKITPAAGEKLNALIRNGDKPNAMLLSKIGDAKTRLIDDFLDVLSENVAITEGSATGAQLLSRQVSSSADKELTRSMVKAADGE